MHLGRADPRDIRWGLVLEKIGLVECLISTESICDAPMRFNDNVSLLDKEAYHELNIKKNPPKT